MKRERPGAGVSLKVGELATRTGLTVRTLHHYDDIGLLTPGRRTGAGHRVYGDAEVRRLQQIASLRQLGLPLDEIRACLDRPGYSLEGVLTLHIERLGEQIGRQERLRDLLLALRDRLHRADDVTVDDLTRTIDVTMNFEKYYTPEQLEQLEQRRHDVGEQRIQEVQNEWNELFAAFGAAMDEGLDPASEPVKALSRRSATLIAEFTGGDPGITASLGRMYEAEGPEKVSADHGMPMRPGLWEYMGKARQALASDG